MQGSTVTADYGASAEKLNGTVSWMLQDGQGSTRQLLNSSQTVVASYITDGFGNSVGGSGSSANPFIWNGGSGYYSDADSGLQKVGARFYDPAVGRWISQDTLLVAGSPADSQAINRYVYCEANPVLKTDPAGHSGLTWGLVGAFGVMFGLAVLRIAPEIEGAAWMGPVGYVCIVIAIVVILWDVYETPDNVGVKSGQGLRNMELYQAAGAGVYPEKHDNSRSGGG